MLEIPEEKLNVDEGAIALGHPLGASGGRLVDEVLQLLKHENARLARATRRIGGGMGLAMTLEAA